MAVQNDQNMIYQTVRTEKCEMLAEKAIVATMIVAFTIFHRPKCKSSPADEHVHFCRWRYVFPPKVHSFVALLRHKYFKDNRNLGDSEIFGRASCGKNPPKNTSFAKLSF